MPGSGSMQHINLKRENVEGDVNAKGGGNIEISGDHPKGYPFPIMCQETPLSSN